MNAAQAPAAFWDTKSKRKRLTVERHDNGVALVFWPGSGIRVGVTILSIKAARAWAEGLLQAAGIVQTAMDKDFPRDIQLRGQHLAATTHLHLWTRSSTNSENREIVLGKMQRARLIETITTMARRG